MRGQFINTNIFYKSWYFKICTPPPPPRLSSPQRSQISQYGSSRVNLSIIEGCINKMVQVDQLTCIANSSCAYHWKVNIF